MNKLVGGKGVAVTGHLGIFNAIKFRPAEFSSHKSAGGKRLKEIKPRNGKLTIRKLLDVMWEVFVGFEIALSLKGHSH